LGRVPSRRYVTFVVASLSLIALVCVTLLLPVPYVTMRPGPTFNTLGDFDGKPMLQFTRGTKTYKDGGTINFTTVLVSGVDAHVTLYDAMAAHFTADTAVVPRGLLYRDGESSKQSKQESHQQLTSSKDSSTVAALRAAGYTVPERAVVAAIVKKAPAVGKLHAGDVVVEAAGRKIGSAQAVVKAVASKKPGQKVDFVVRRKGKLHTVTMKTVADPSDPKKPRVGVLLASKFTFPIKVSNQVGDRIGGPSAGGMFALAIYDRLTPGSLTGGKRIAGTGEIKPDGTIAPIGGIRQKMAGAANDGATIFLVPSANCANAAGVADAAGRVHGMRLVRIKTLKGAIGSLRALASDPKAKVPGCGTSH
jgi:PDZ domain-containing protein